MIGGRWYSPRMIMRSTAVFVLVASLGVARSALALDLNAQYEFRIAPQKLTTALVELSRQANAPVVSDTLAVERFDSSGISGRMALKQALRTLLEGTDLQYRVTDEGVIAIGMFVRHSPRGMDFAYSW